mmetsp:Transcript_12075/g.37241  ORF Transcript_12075/g.37241 Transcript_12075/m.37241 type:complete len:221 (+) Transcript_12075:1542-2204(+)
MAALDTKCDLRSMFVSVVWPGAAPSSSPSRAHSAKSSKSDTNSAWYILAKRCSRSYSRGKQGAKTERTVCRRSTSVEAASSNTVASCPCSHESTARACSCAVSTIVQMNLSRGEAAATSAAGRRRSATSASSSSTAAGVPLGPCSEAALCSRTACSRSSTARARATSASGDACARRSAFIATASKAVSSDVRARLSTSWCFMSATRCSRCSVADTPPLRT